MQDTNMKFNKEVKILKENQAEMLEMKNLESQIKKTEQRDSFTMDGGGNLSMFEDKIKQLYHSVKDKHQKLQATE